MSKLFLTVEIRLLSLHRHSNSLENKSLHKNKESQSKSRYQNEKKSLRKYNPNIWSLSKESLKNYMNRSNRIFLSMTNKVLFNLLISFLKKSFHQNRILLLNR